ncbi:HAMP domain-containing sensor histidine kinase [Streptococcaceae bacterium ESL0729]|nr:HAMP domain-containing sensor histidine kinase [Streptococcaceae bacterium ESL0729]
MKAKSKFIILSLIYLLTSLFLVYTSYQGFLTSQLKELEGELTQVSSNINDSSDFILPANVKIYTSTENLPADVENVFKGSKQANLLVDGNLYLSIPLKASQNQLEVIRIGQKFNSHRGFLIILTSYLLALYLLFLGYYLKEQAKQRREIDQSQKLIDNFRLNPYQEHTIINSGNQILEQFNSYSDQVHKTLTSKNWENKNLCRLIDTFEFPVFVYGSSGRLLGKNEAFSRNFPQIEKINSFTSDSEFLSFLLANLIDKTEGQGQFYFKNLDKYFQVKLAQINPTGAKQTPSYLASMQEVTELVKAKISQDNFVANVSHELKTPLTSIIGFSNLIANQDLSPDQIKEFGQIIEKEAKRLENLVQDTLKLTKNTKEITKEKIRIDLLVQDVLDNLSIQIKDKQMIIIKNLSSLEYPTNYELFYGIAKNLIENAIFYSPPAKQVIISLREAENKLYFEVKDQGPGISLIDQKKIFERFYRIDSARKNITDGTGLGLPIVQHNTSLLKGQVRLISKLREGSSFTIILPNKKES